jgi:hypothetical protein
MPACGPFDLICQIPSEIAETAFGKIAQAFAEAPQELLKWTFTWWTKIPSPNVETNPAALWLQTRTSWLVGVVAVLMLLWMAGRTMMMRSGEPLEAALWAVLRLVLVTGAGVAVTQLLIRIGDSLAAWFIQTAKIAGGTDTIWSAADVGTQNVALLFLCGFLATVGAIAQAGIIIARGAVLILFTALLPLAAAGSATPLGKTMWSRTVGWTLAFILYKPVAAAIYGVGLILVDPKLGGVMNLLYGTAILWIAVFSLGALIKLLVPAAAAMGGGSGGAAAAGAVVTGAVILATGGSAAPAAASAAGAAAPLLAGPQGAAQPEGAS